ncbi:nSTAND1 domain-containing NTPase [Streptomyces hiroshimensis]|uniref:nSTAND1 domain-containing NTPase n=1 Tax=Streptomyces hiroshimensis TaxID=66424 RepID=UPI00167A2588|nr:helix-turn-helix domain-containing protein [Streptomyces hiroshimensis]
MRRLRLERGVSLVKLARLAFYSKGYLSKVENGEKPLTLELARACDHALETGGALELLVPVPAGDKGGSRPEDHGVCPYRGLSPFGAEDARWFFGRDAETAGVVAQLTERLTLPGPLLVMAPSGAGKSSLLRAGMLPALARGALPVAGSHAWPAVLLTPGERPVRELLSQVTKVTGGAHRLLEAALNEGPGAFAAAVRDAVAGHGSPDRTSGPGRSPGDSAAEAAAALVVVVDQFEELFTLCRDGQERAVFVEALLALATGRGDTEGGDTEGGLPTALVVLGVRADFYDRCLAYPGLAASLQHGHITLGPMNDARLREAITAPAREAGLEVEAGLVEVLLRDIGLMPGNAADTGVSRAGALPLLSHALLSTWQHRENATLTVAGYRLTGGISGAVAATAERAYTSLPTDRQAVARRILLQLVHVGEDRETSHRTHRTHLLEDRPTRETTEDVLEVFTRARLLTVDADHVEPAHEILLHAWPRLRAWIDDDRAGLRTRQLLAETAAAWEEESRDKGLLYRGTRLAAAREWAADPARRATLSPVAQAFLDASTDHETAERKKEQRRSRGMRRLLAGLVILLTLALIATGVAFWQRQAAVTAQREAQSRQMAAQSSALLDSDPDLASLLAVQAHRTGKTDEATASLYAAATLPLRHRLTGHTGAVTSVAFDPGGKTLATGSSDGTARMWDVATGRVRTTLTGHSAPVRSVAFSPDGRTLATGSDDRTVRLWDVSTEETHGLLTGHTRPVASVAFSPDGLTVASIGGDGTVRLWDVARGAIHATFAPGARVTSLAFSPDGKTLATAGEDRTTRLWDITTETISNTLVAKTAATVQSVVFSPGGKSLITAGYDGTVQLWDVTTGKARTLPMGQLTSAESVAFSPDGQTLATSSVKSIRLWDVATGMLRNTFTGHSAPVRSVAFSPDGKTLATGSSDSTARIWDITTGKARSTLTGQNSPVEAVAFSPDGKTLATSNYDKSVRVWDVATRRIRRTLAGHTALVASVAFSPDGRVLAAGGYDGSVRLWDINAAKTLRILPKAAAPVGRVAFSPDGKTLVTGSQDTTVRIWDIATGTLRNTRTGHTVPGGPAVISPDGKAVATGSLPGDSDRTARVRDVGTGRTRTITTDHTARVVLMAFSPDGRTLATSSGEQSLITGSFDDTVALWDAGTGKARNVITGVSGNVLAMAFSPDGRTIATSGDDRTVRLWDVATGKSRSVFPQNATQVVLLEFSPDGKTLATGSGDSAVQLWDVDLPDAAEAGRRVCRALHRDFTRRERSSYVRDQASGPVCPA